MDEAALLEVGALDIAAGGRLLHRGLAFSLRRGEVLVVVGPSGGGKSTLMRHLVGLERPAAGQVRMFGHDPHAADTRVRAEIGRRLGVMFQTGALWSSMSIGENLMFPMRLHTRWPEAERRDRARFLLALVGLSETFDRPPAELSGGMRKRAALARALVLDPSLLLLDEPGSGLDPPNAERVRSLLMRLSRDLRTAIVMVSHDVDSARALADTVLFLDDQGGGAPIGPLDRLLHEGSPALRAFFGGMRPAREQA